MTCKHLDTSVIDSRPRPDGSIYRRRECLDCGDRFNTDERPSERTLNAPACPVLTAPPTEHSPEAPQQYVPSEIKQPIWSVINSYKVISNGDTYADAAAIRDKLYANGMDEGLVVVPDEVAQRMQQGKKLY